MGTWRPSQYRRSSKGPAGRRKTLRALCKLKPQCNLTDLGGERGRMLVAMRTMHETASRTWGGRSNDEARRDNCRGTAMSARAPWRRETAENASKERDMVTAKVAIGEKNFVTQHLRTQLLAAVNPTAGAWHGTSRPGAHGMAHVFPHMPGHSPDALAV